MCRYYETRAIPGHFCASGCKIDLYTLFSVKTPVGECWIATSSVKLGSYNVVAQIAVCQ